MINISNVDVESLIKFAKMNDSEKIKFLQSRIQHMNIEIKFLAKTLGDRYCYKKDKKGQCNPDCEFYNDSEFTFTECWMKSAKKFADKYVNNELDSEVKDEFKYL